MEKTAISAFIAVLIALSGIAYARAAGDMTAQSPIEVKVTLGDEQNALRFFPAISPLKRENYIS